MLRTELKNLARLAAPIAAAQAGLALMGLIDTAVVGRLGIGPLGAVGLANGLFFGLAVVGMGVVMGLDPLFAQAFGALDLPRARALLWQGIWLALFVSIPITLCISLTPLLLGPFGISGALAADARAFLFWRLPGLFPLLAFVALRAYLQAAGITWPLLVATVLANLANLGLDILFVFGGHGPLSFVPAMGAAGAGAATSICTVLQLGVMLLAAARLQPTARPRRGPVRRDLHKALKLGVPVGLQMGAEVGVFALVGLFAGRLGNESLAAHQIALALASFTFCFAMGIGQAGSVRVGWAIGAGDSVGARRAGFVAFGAGALFMALAALSFWLVPGPLSRILTDQPELLASAARLLAVVAVFEISDGVQGVGAGVLRGAGDTRFPFIANLLGHYAIGLPVALLLSFRFGQGVLGLWWGLAAGLTAVAVALFWRFSWLSSRPIAPLEAHAAPRHTGEKKAARAD